MHLITPEYSPFILANSPYPGLALSEPIPVEHDRLGIQTPAFLAPWIGSHYAMFISDYLCPPGHVYPSCQTPHSFSFPARPLLPKTTGHSNSQRSPKWTKRKKPQARQGRRASRLITASLCPASFAAGPLRVLSISNAISALVSGPGVIPRRGIGQRPY